MPNVISNLLSGAEKDFDVVKAAIEKDWAAIVRAVPSLGPIEAKAVSLLKQQASNALAYADTALSSKLADAASMVESAADTLMLSLVGPAGAALVPVVNVGISQGFAILHAALDHAEAAAKAKLALPSTVSIVAGLSGFGGIGGHGGIANIA